MLSRERLSRVLWYTERNVQLLTGRPLTGATYVKQHDAPQARPLAAVLLELEKAGDVAVRRESAGEYETEQYFALRKPDISALSAEMISSLDITMRDICFGVKASIPNKDAHDRILRAAAVGEIIPYYTIFAGQQASIERIDLDWALRELHRRPERQSALDIDALGVMGEACKALWWHLLREPSVGISVPILGESVFIYRQRGATSTVSDIVALYKMDLDELLVLGLQIAGEEDSEEIE